MFDEERTLRFVIGAFKVDMTGNHVVLSASLLIAAILVVVVELFYVSNDSNEAYLLLFYSRCYLINLV